MISYSILLWYLEPYSPNEKCGRVGSVEVCKGLGGTPHPKLEMGGFLQSSVLPEYGSSTTKIQNVYDETTGKMIPKKVTVYDPNLPDYALGGVGRRETDLVGFEYGDTNAQFKKDFAKKIKDGEQIKLSTKDFEKYLTPTKLKKLSDANLYNEKEISHNIKDATKYTGILGTGDAGGIFPSSEVEQYLTGLRKGKVVEDAAIKKAATKGSFAADFAPMLGNALMIYGLLNEKPLVPASAPQGGSGTQVATQNLYDRERYKYGLL